MPMTNKLLENIHFGNELEKLSKGSSSTFELISHYLPKQAKYLQARRERVVQMATRFHRARNPGRFGGQVSAGDTVFIGAFLAALQPSAMIEIGVCSGQSSAFILVAADRMGLTKEDTKFLYSFDLEEFFENETQPIGQVVFKGFSRLIPHWALHKGETSLDLLKPEHSARRALNGTGPTLAFVDAEHRHPWPLIDTLVLSCLLPKDSWILLQDIRLTERWLANSIERGVVCPKPERGVGFIYEYWPGTKFSGLEMCYNMAAIKNDISSDQRLEFAHSCMRFPPELSAENFPDMQVFLAELNETSSSIDAAVSSAFE